MMRRKNTSRLVQTFSSVSILSDEIAATDMALSRDWSREPISDSWVGARDREGAFVRGLFIRGLLASWRRKINLMMATACVIFVSLATLAAGQDRGDESKARC
jgi:hypothetical protein